MSDPAFPYLKLSYPAGNRINDTISQLHHAVQYIALVGKAYGIEKDDDSHTAMAWNPEQMAYVGKIVNLPPKFKVAVHAVKLNIVLLNNDIREFASLRLPGVTKGYAFAWLKEQVAALGGDHTRLNKNMHYQIPGHPVALGKIFRIHDPEAFREAAKYRTNAGHTLAYIRSQYSDTSEILIWPHHFDTGVLVNLARNKQGNVIKTIGAGFAIADESVPEPYFFINSWAEEGLDYPGKLPLLRAGSWNTKGWTGAVLPLGEILKIDDENGQQDLIKTFFDSGIQKTLQFFS